VGRIVRAVSVPVSADIEHGYGLSPRELIGRLMETGAVGCNLEDSEHGKLKDSRQHADWLAEVRAESGDAVFINLDFSRICRWGCVLMRESACPARHSGIC